MPMQAALAAMKSQLDHWTTEREAAASSGNVARVEQCEHFVAQCQMVIASLERAQSSISRNGAS